jgi:hypothetical protein
LIDEQTVLNVDSQIDKKNHDWKRQYVKKQSEKGSFKAKTNVKEALGINNYCLNIFKMWAGCIPLTFGSFL